MKDSLREIYAKLQLPVDKRLFAEYGAIFVSRATPPPVILFADAAQVESFQACLPIEKVKLGEYDIELQAEAMKGLLFAVTEAERRGLTITPRAVDSARRSYAETVQLWLRNVTRGLEHWQREGRMDEARADLIHRLEPSAQVAVILEIEAQEEIFFGTFFNRSILYSVAAPGASQHLSCLAFDVAQYQDETVEAILNDCGWHRTVVNDLPHYTYLGYVENELPQLGLKQVAQEYGEQTFRYWIPDIG
jgi:hypothetical protein